ncbi:MAG TPA: type II toxin-antitoxin system HicA family toxin [Bryobacteraceae bacterium]|nr:type II toxin-antitoxin system HicA family toxin [Bryobacteraceae bacterium]
MNRLSPAKPRQVLRALQRAGFVVHHTSGSHYILKHPGRPGARVTLPYHNRDLKRRTLESILDQAGLTHEEFRSLL